MQGAHHFAGGVKIGSEIIHAEQGHRSQQSDLTGAMDGGMFLVFDRSQAEGNKDDHDQQCNGEKHKFPCVDF